MNESMSESKDPKGYYKTLNIPPNSDAKTIKNAYSKLQKTYHSSGVGRKAMRQSDEYKKMTEEQKNLKEQEFDEICMKLNEAYNVLSNPERKKQYDEGSGEFAPKFEGFNMGDGDFPFSEFFADFTGGGRSERKQRYKVKDTITEIKITLKEAFTGKKSKFRIKIKKKCTVCDGKGASELKKCNKCGGRGVLFVKKKLGIMLASTEVSCDACSGEGEVASGCICVECHGGKLITVSEIVEVDIPSGVEDGTKIVFRERGNQIPNHRSGDIVFIVNIESDKKFMRVNNDIIAMIDIDILTALSGGWIGFEHLDGRKFSVHVAPFKSFDKGLCISSEGFKSGGKIGDLYLQPNVIINSGLSRDKLSEYLKPLIVYRASVDSKDVISTMKKIPTANNNQEQQETSDNFHEFSNKDFFKGFRFF